MLRKMSPTLEEIKDLLRKHKKELKERFKVKSIAIFGSYARGEQKKESDVDMIIEFVKEESLGAFKFIGLMMDLEEYLQEILGKKVHLAPKSQAIKSKKWKSIEKELTYI